MNYHPLSEIFPLMQGREFDELVADISKHGQREPIWICDGAILDGRNRWRACQQMGIDPVVQRYEGNDPLAFVISLNLHRRHLDESQRAMVAAKIANMPQGARTDLASIEAMSQTSAAALLNVGRASVQRARTVLDDGDPALVHAVESGRVSVSVAADLAALPLAEQSAVVQLTDKQILERAKEIRGNHRLLGTGENEWYTPSKYIDAARTVLGEIDIDPASSERAQETVEAVRYFTAQDNGLTREWHGRVWMNPPYSQPEIQLFTEKLVFELSAGRAVAAIALTHNYTDTAWFHAAASVCRAICFTRGRVKFVNPAGEEAAPTQGSAFFYFGDDPEGFEKVFSQFGLVLRRE